jgi:hypothetical protein
MGGEGWQDKNERKKKKKKKVSSRINDHNFLLPVPLPLVRFPRDLRPKCGCVALFGNGAGQHVEHGLGRCGGNAARGDAQLFFLQRVGHGHVFGFRESGEGSTEESDMGKKKKKKKKKN